MLIKASKGEWKEDDQLKKDLQTYVSQNLKRSEVLDFIYLFFCILLIFINSKLHTFFINKHNSHKQTDTVHHISTYTIHSSS